MRSFEEVKPEFKKFPNVKTCLPERSDAKSAGYDFYSKENYVINPKESHVFWTDVKAQMYFDNVLNIYARSGLGCKYGVVPKNCTGIIDASYYGNEKNDGGIGICLENKGDEPYSVKVGDRIAQGVFMKYYITDDDKYVYGKEKDNGRKGGFGSSDEVK